MVESNKKPQPSLTLGIIACIGGLLAQLVVGALYQWGIVSIYITSYYKMTDDSLTLEQSSIVSSIMMITVGFTMVLGLHLCKLTHPLIILFAAQVLQAVCVFAASYMTNFWLFVLFYGIIFSIIAGIGFMIPMVECNKYLVGKKMYVNGFILVGTGLGSVIFGQFSYNFLNPDDLSPLNGYYIGTPELQSISLQLPSLMRWLSLMYLLIGLLGSAMVVPVILRNRQAEMEHEIKRKEKQLAHQAKKHKTHNNQENHQTHSNLQQNQVKQTNQNKHKKHLTRHQRKHLHEAHSIIEGVKSRIFWISNIMLLFASIGVFLVTSNYKTLVRSTIKDDEFLTLIGVIGGIGNGCSRFFWNLFFSKTGFKTVLLTILTLSVAVFATIRFTVDIKEAYLVEIFILNCCLGGFLVATPTGLQSIYGHTVGSSMYGIYWETFSIGNLIAWVYVSQLTNLIGFNNIIYICLAMAVLAYPAVVFIKFQGPWQNDTTQLQFCVKRQIQNRDIQREKQHQKQHQNQINDQIQIQNTTVDAIVDKKQISSESTASHIPSFIDLKFHKNSNNDKKAKIQDSKMELTSLKIIDQTISKKEALSPGIYEKQQKSIQIPTYQSNNVLIEGKS